jgi:hypothetical protein
LSKINEILINEARIKAMEEGDIRNIAAVVLENNYSLQDFEQAYRLNSNIDTIVLKDNIIKTGDYIIKNLSKEMKNG